MLAPKDGRCVGLLAHLQKEILLHDQKIIVPGVRLGYFPQSDPHGGESPVG